MAIVIGAGMRIGAGMAISSGTPIRSEPIPISMVWAFTDTVPVDFGSGLSSVIWDDTKFVAINGGVSGYYSNSGAYSYDGLSWTETTLPREARGIFGIAYGEGITVAPYYESRNVAVSTDGITWTKEVTVLPSVRDDLGSVFETTVMGVAYGNGKFIAVDLIQDLTLVSDDGLTWDYGGNVALGYQQGFPTGLGYKISIQFGGGTFMIRTQNTFNSVHGGVIRSTDDGASWSVSEFSGPDGSWVIGYGNGAWVALPLTGESTGRTIGMISTDSGNTWANTTIPAGLYSSIVHDGTKFVGMPNTGNIIVSGNGTTWTSITTPDFQGEPSVQNIAVNPQISAYGDGMIVALTGYEEGGIGKALYSGSVGNPITYSYSITSNISSVNEGNTVGFTVSTSNVPNDTVLYWTTVGNVSSADFSDSVTSGNITIANGSASITRTLTADSTTEGVEYFDLELRTGSISGTIVATSGNVTVGDTSIDPVLSYSIIANVSSVNEGNSVQFTVTTENVSNGTILYWTTTGNVISDDFTDNLSSGNITITENSGTITRTISADTTTEGTEYFATQLRTGSISGTIVATSGNVTIADTSLDPVALLDVWSSGGSLGTARSYMGRAGTQTAALGMGGYRIMGNFNETEEYDGSAWASSDNMNTGRFKVGSDGTQTAAIAFGSALGSTTDDSEEYDGSSWSSGGTMLYGRFRSTGCGTQTATLAIGASGYPTSANKCDEYDGSSWSAGGDLIGSYRDAASAGTQTAGLIVGGDGYLSSTEEYNGTSWSAGGSLLSGRQYHGAAGLQTAALAFGGVEASSIGTTGSTEKYDGTSWTSGGSLINTAILGQAGTGSQSAGLSFGGYSTDTSSVVAITEEYSS
jgi:hypothetical protein